METVERYRLSHGFYRASVHADRIYRTRDNIRYCTQCGIRLSGPRLGRPPKNSDPNARKQAHEDAFDRSWVESKFGEGKRKYGLNLVKTKLQETSETVIAINLIVMNLAYLFRLFLSFFQRAFFTFSRHYFCQGQAGFYPL